MPDRPRIAIQRQLAALACRYYELIFRQWTGRWDYRIRERQMVTAADFMSSVADIRRCNAQGCDVWIVPRPANDQAWLVLVGDLDAVAVAAMRADGITPVAVAETSSGNHQAWVRVPRRVQAMFAARALCSRYDGEPGGIADWDQRVRLAGFCNRKPCHLWSDGRYPYVLLRSSRPLARALEPNGAIPDGGPAPA